MAPRISRPRPRPGRGSAGKPAVATLPRVRTPLTRIAVCLLIAVAAAQSLAAPRPEPRRLPAASARAGLAAPFHAAESDAASGPCGTRLEAAFELAERRAALALAAPLPTPHSVDAAGIAVLEDDGTFFYPDKSGNNVLDVAAVTHAWFRTHDDDAEMLALYLASGLNEWLGSPTALAAAWPIRNAIDGIGLSHFDAGAAFGSPARLEMVMTMNGLHRYLDDPDEVWPGDTFDAMGILAHEFGHRWSSYTFVDSAGTTSPALLGRDWQHWNFFFDSDSSFMEGCDWTAVGPDTFVTTGATTTFGALDQYLMGLRTKAETGPLVVVNEPVQMNPPGVYVPYSIPGVGIGCDGRATTWSVDDIEHVHGPRVPNAVVAPHSWRVAFVLVVPRGQGATPADLAKLGAIRSRFPQVVAEATGGRGAVDVSLPSRPGRLVIAHDPLRDTEDAGLPRTFTARVTHEEGGMPYQVAPPSVRLHWRAGPAGAWSEVAMASVGEDSFTAQLPAPAGTFEYWLSAGSSPPGLVSQWPAAGPAAPFSFFVGPDTQSPTVEHSPVPAQADTRMPQVLLARVTDNAGVDSVWCEVSVDGGPHVNVPAAHAGGDSFTVALGAGLGAGHHVAYRFLARDGSIAGNLAASNASFDTMHIVRDFLDDFENPSGYLHQPLIWSYRDPWAVDTFRSSPAGGASWHFGAAEGLPYPPHSDAALLLPWIYGVSPGVTLSLDEWHDLEQDDPSHAWDAFRLELATWGSTASVPVEPTPGYTHTMRGRSLSIPRNAECWSGDTQGWVTRTLDLSAYGPDPVRVQVHACADDWLGAGGVWIDRVRVHFPGGASVGVPVTAAGVGCGRAWPNPTRGALRLPLTLARASEVDWALHDVQGRRVATLWRGAAEPGSNELLAATPRDLAPGLYFARLRVNGVEAAAAQRIAIVR